MAEPVAVVGMAALFPGAPDLAAYWRNILAGVDAITEVPAARWDPSYFDPGAATAASSDRFYCRRGGFVDPFAEFDPTRFGIMPRAVAGTEPDQLLALRVAAAAIADAGGEERFPDRARIGVILGRGGYLTPGIARLDARVRTAHQLVATLRELLPGLNEQQLVQVRQAFQARLGPEQPDTSIGLVPNLAASRIANRLDLQGPAYTVDAACASSLVAVDQAVRELVTGRCDAVLAGGVHHCHDVTLWSVFTQLRALSPSQRVRPFHRDADGILIGEGTGMIVLKRLADADRDGDRVYAVIRGTGVASDGRAASLMKPRADGQVLALERAWRDTGLDPAAPGSIGLLEAHGTATPAGDATELASLTRVFGAGGGPGTSADIGIGSVKSMIGHAMPAAGIAGLIKAALAVYHGKLPPTLHCDQPHPALAGTRFRPVTEAEPWQASAAGPRRAAVNAFGFGGINAHVVVEERRAGAAQALPVRTRPDRPERVLLLAGPGPDQIIRQLREDPDLLGRDDAHAPPGTGPFRLAIVGPTARRLELARKVVTQGKPWRGRNDVWFTGDPLLHGDGTRRGGVAFIFPGLEQSFEPRVDDVAAHFRLPRPDLSGAAALGRHGLGVIGVGRLLDAALRKLGLVPDLLAGHSIGEWNAMIAAGIYPEDAVNAFIEAFDPDTVQVPGVVFAAIGCGADQAAAAIAGTDQVVVSHDNCPHQSIVCGEPAGVTAVLNRLRAQGVLGQVLPFQSGFHSPMLAPHLGPIQTALGGLPVRSPVVPLWSATTVAPYPQRPEEIRALVIRHLLEPVRFRELVQGLYAQGVRAFVQVGAGSLTGFVSDTLCAADHLAVAANTAQRSGLDQLRRVAAALWTEGLAPRFDRLPGARTDPPAGRSVRLDLGAPLVRLGETAVPLVPARAPAPAPLAGPAGADHPLLAEFDAVLRESTRAAQDVLDAWRRPVAPGPRQATTTRLLSLETMPALADHCFYRQPPGWPDATDRFPVVPMTTTVELMLDAARELVPERTVVGIQRIQALRWLAVAPPVTVTIKASYDGRAEVKVLVDGYAQGTVLLADDYPQPDHAQLRLTGERPADVTARQLYGDRWMFHGPAFQGVTELGPLADDGIRGVLAALPAPGALLDSAGQVMGFWIMKNTVRDRLALPRGIDRVRFFGPHPRPGERLSCVARIRTLTDAAVRGDIELRTGDGRLWARVEGWEDRRFDIDEVVWDVLFHPERRCIATEQPGGWYLVSERWQDAATRELIMRRYLGARERAEYAGRNPRAQRQWLLGRIAVKDAARRWLWGSGHGPVYPAEIGVRNDATGRPLLDGPFDPAAAPVQVSLAHSGSLAVALLRPEAVGIDIERIEDHGDGIEATALTKPERALLDRRDQDQDRPAWFTRFWTAKEAAAKAAGTGLAGNPRRFAVERVHGDRLLVTAPDRACWVETTVLPGPDRHVVAWTSPANAGGEG